MVYIPGHPPCPSPFTQVEEYCFYLDKSDRTFTQHNFECKRRGGNLVKIETAAKADIIQKILSGTKSLAPSQLSKN